MKSVAAPKRQRRVSKRGLDMIENPQSAAPRSLLLLVVPGIVAVALALTRRISPTHDVSVVIAPGVAVALALLPLHFVARWLGSFTSGLVLSWLLLGSIGYVLLFAQTAALRFPRRTTPDRRNGEGWQSQRSSPSASSRRRPCSTTSTTKTLYGGHQRDDRQSPE